MKKGTIYDHLYIEKKWRKKWANSKIYRSKEDRKKDKYFVLDMFPYPSGEGLHVGHPKGYIATDVISRMKRMQGKSVLHPMGFDAFGLPAENYAIKTKTNPADAVSVNVKRFKKQLEIIGLDYDWSREINTTDPGYYKWTQWIFLQLLEKGLAYESNEPVNWCPTDKTVLANEDVENGRCERCGTLVEKKPMRQWVLKITEYAERLLNDLDAKRNDSSLLLDWPESIKEAQRNWIGKSEGAEIDFKLNFNGPKTKFVILHGYTGSASRNFIPWLKSELEKRGHEVQAPELPNTKAPVEEEQVNYFLTNCKIDQNTVIVGHSLGGVVALKAIMKLGKPIGGIVLVAPALDPDQREDGYTKSYHKTFKWNFDFNEIKMLAGGKIAILSDSQEDFRVPYLKFLAGKLSARLIDTTAEEEHFCALQEPEVLKAVTPSVKVFTTRPDTIFGATYLVLAPEHPWAKELLPRLENRHEVEEYISKSKLETEIERTDAKKEKTGVELKGVKAVNPATNEEVPVWISDYVLVDYGTGAVMAVPAHDERDAEFAKKFGLPIRIVIEPKFIGTTGDGAVKPGLEYIKREAVCAIVRNPKDNKYLCISWKGHHMHGLVTGGIENDEDIANTAKREVEEETGYKNLKLIRVSPIRINTYFYHRVKQQNRWAHFHFVFFDLIDEDKSPINEKEASLHEVVWKSQDELKDFFSVFEGDFLLNIMENDNYVHTEPGIMIESGKFTGRDSESVKKEITESVRGKWVTKYKLRDWVFSRQRYWGEPIPVIHCETCGVVPVPEKDLPVKLPRVTSYEPTGTGESPLAAISKWVNVKCPMCKGRAKRETNTMPQWAGSSWYHLRFMDPKNKKALVGVKAEKYWSPVDLYVGGAEHATRHLIYARFWHKFLYDLGVMSTIEPFIKLQSVGLIMGEDSRKMSKRFGNVVNPDDIVTRFGADTLRIYEMFMGPFDQQITWSTDSMVGSRRFVEKVWRLGCSVISMKTSVISAKAEIHATNDIVTMDSRLRGNDNNIQENDKTVGGIDSSIYGNSSEERSSTDALTKLLHRTIKKVTEDIQSLKFNTAISSLMIVVNEMEKADTIDRHQFELLLLLLAPFAPHITEEIWNRLGNKKSIHIAEWPKYDSTLIQDDEVNIVVQINGKVRDSFMTSKTSDNQIVENTAKSLPGVQKWLEGKTITKIVVIPNRLVNIVCAG